MTARKGAKKPSKAFQQIMAGLEDAKAFLAGDKSRGRLTKVPIDAKKGTKRPTKKSAGGRGRGGR